MTYIAHKAILLNGEEHYSLQYEPTYQDIKLAMKQAYLKSQYTKNGNQNAQPRTPYEKFSKQFEGILGEISILKTLEGWFLQNKTNLSVNRYDDVRTDGYKSPSGEYDLKVIAPSGLEIYIEARASISYKTSLEKAITGDIGLTPLDTIGPYTNFQKMKESGSGLYFRPLFQLKNPNPNLKIKDIDFFKSFINNEFQLFITGGATLEMMDSLGKLKNMGQKNTLYKAIPISQGMDIKRLLQHLLVFSTQ